MSPKVCVASGPATTDVKSRTRMPANGPAINAPNRIKNGRHGCSRASLASSTNRPQKIYQADAYRNRNESRTFAANEQFRKYLRLCRFEIALGTGRVWRMINRALGSMYRLHYCARRRGDRRATFFTAAQNVCFWHKADMTMPLSDVRFWGHRIEPLQCPLMTQSGHQRLRIAAALDLGGTVKRKTRSAIS